MVTGEKLPSERLAGCKARRPLFLLVHTRVMIERVLVSELLFDGGRLLLIGHL